MLTNPEKLASWRKLQGWSQEEAANRFGVPQGTWAPWETGKKKPDRDNAPALEAFTGGTVKAADWSTKKKRRGKRLTPTTTTRRTGTDG